MDSGEYKWLGKVSEKKEINQEGNHEELKPCLEHPAKTKENSLERPSLTDERAVLVISTYQSQCFF